ncbi:hypothetical protein LHA31_12505 (plasmid) [Carnobacterium viridans]|uniref:hypothetical protein n=1 Tax=Carnobacterium viridans TaxID=174587 RepID=UPI001CFFF37F|nr:hypothetical protein [Carnobacterium viridans]UDE96465.1 hypothetical protein LHA31_12505 [Carnobacterium viridans]
MADSLLNKNKNKGKRNLLERKEEVKPKEAFNRASLFTVDESQQDQFDKKKNLFKKAQKERRQLFDVQQIPHID